MGIFFITFFIICLFACFLYIFFIVSFIFGWLNIEEHTINPTHTPDTKVAVLIAARNEEVNIKNCISSLINQNYPENLIEILIIDDNSDDNTLIVCKDLIAQLNIGNITLIELKKFNKISKKEAIKIGVEHASSRLILTTDADCVLNPNWVLNMLSFYKTHNFKLITGPVVYNKTSGILHPFQLLDFLSFIVSGAGAIGARMAFLSNAANMAFEKEAFFNVMNENYDNNVASGDDVFLLHKIKNRYPNGIGFIKMKDSIVITEGVKTIKELFYQRIRWASKSTSYKDKHALLISLSVFLFNLVIVASIILSLIYSHFLLISITLLLFKIIIDFPLLYQIINFNERKYLLYHYLWVQLLYPFYITTIAISSFFVRKYPWKGRTNIR